MYACTYMCVCVCVYGWGWGVGGVGECQNEFDIVGILVRAGWCVCGWVCMYLGPGVVGAMRLFFCLHVIASRTAHVHLFFLYIVSCNMYIHIYKTFLNMLPWYFFQLMLKMSENVVKYSEFALFKIHLQVLYYFNQLTHECLHGSQRFKNLARTSC